MTRAWPSNKPLPRFASEEEELAFWERHDVPWDDEAQWQEVPGPVVAIGGTKVSREYPLEAATDAMRDVTRHRVGKLALAVGPR